MADFEWNGLYAYCTGNRDRMGRASEQHRYLARMTLDICHEEKNSYLLERVRIVRALAFEDPATESLRKEFSRLLDTAVEYYQVAVHVKSAQARLTKLKAQSTREAAEKQSAAQSFPRQGLAKPPTPKRRSYHLAAVRGGGSS